MFSNFILSRFEVKIIFFHLHVQILTSLACYSHKKIAKSPAVLELSQLMRHICSVSVQEGRRSQTVSGGDGHSIFLSGCSAVTGPNPGAAEMTGERCQSLWSATGSSGRILHTHPSLVSNRFCHFPLLSIRAAAASPRVELYSGRLPGQQGAENSTPHACQPLHHHRATGGPSREAAWAGCHN